MKFFLIGVIFLIFDVEVSLLIPIPFRQLFVLLFLLLLLVGLLYEWYYGGLDWLVYVNRAFFRHYWLAIERELTARMADAGGQSHEIHAIDLIEMVKEKENHNLFCSTESRFVDDPQGRRFRGKDLAYREMDEDRIESQVRHSPFPLLGINSSH